MDDTPTAGFRDRPVWLAAVAVLVLAQAGLGLGLFGPGRSPTALADDRPVTAGRHPLHLYHGSLGADAFRSRHATTCYDPAFQAGYPKTPVFDGGSRPAELVLTLAGGGYRPGAYKAGLLAVLLAIPLAFVLAARGAGLPAGAAVLAGVVGTLLGWTAPVRRVFDAGDTDVLTAGLAAVVLLPWLGRYAKWFGVDSWLVLAGAVVVGWYAHPVVWVGLTPVVVGYYLVLAPRHGPAWHLGLAGVTVAGIAPNAWWLADWGRYWWLRQPAAGDQIPLPAWADLAGGPADYAGLCGCVPGGLAVAVVGAAGLVLVWRNGHRTAAALLAVGAAVAVACARVAAVWLRVPADVPDRLVPLAAGFLVPPAAFAAWTLLGRARAAGPAVLAAVIGLFVVGWADGPSRPLASALRLNTERLPVGLNTEQRQLLDAIRTHTTADARILIDETSDRRLGWNWTALLPRLTERAFLGGLDPDAGVEHSYCGLRDGKLNGRSLADWTDADLAVFARWYNVGWVVCRSPAAADRWGRFPGATAVARQTEAGQRVTVFALDRPRAFVLTGSAVWEEASPTRVTLRDVTPDATNGVELSLHHLEGLRVYPSYVRLDPVPDPTGRDPINHVRLRLPGPVPRVTLVWENP